MGLSFDQGFSPPGFDFGKQGGTRGRLRWYEAAACGAAQNGQDRFEGPPRGVGRRAPRWPGGRIVDLRRDAGCKQARLPRRPRPAGSRPSNERKARAGVDHAPGFTRRQPGTHAAWHRLGSGGVPGARDDNRSGRFGATGPPASGGWPTATARDESGLETSARRQARGPPRRRGGAGGRVWGPLRHHEGVFSSASRQFARRIWEKPREGPSDPGPGIRTGQGARKKGRNSCSGRSTLAGGPRPDGSTRWEPAWGRAWIMVQPATTRRPTALVGARRVSSVRPCFWEIRAGKLIGEGSPLPPVTASIPTAESTGTLGG